MSALRDLRDTLIEGVLYLLVLAFFAVGNAAWMVAAGKGDYVLATLKLWRVL